MNALRIDRARQLNARLKSIEELTLPWEPPHCEHIYYGYTVMVPADWAGMRRDEVCRLLNDEYGVGAVVMNDVTAVQHPLVRDHVAGQQTPVSDLTGKRLFCVSLHPLMTDDDLDYIAQSAAQAVERVKAD